MTTPMRVIVTGSRTWTDAEAIHRALDYLADAYPSLTVVHGCARGADMIADEWVRDRKRRGWPVSAGRFPAYWKRYGKRAGYVRNKQMVDIGADVCLAFILDGSRGATLCADLAEANDIPTQRIERSSDGE